MPEHKEPESKESESRLLLKQGEFCVIKPNVNDSPPLHSKPTHSFMPKNRSKIIGINNSLPWNIPEDLKNFKRLTMGHPVIMGRKTFDSIGKPLPGRFNIVISRNKNLSLPCAVVAHSLDEAIEIAKQQNPTEVFVIGGAQIYKKALPKADKMYITEVRINVKGDAKFPHFAIHQKPDNNLLGDDTKKDTWKETKRAGNRSSDLTHFYFVEYERHKGE